METIVVIGIIALAGSYVIRVFYRKFRLGQSYEGSSCCSGCGCSSTCDQKNARGNCQTG